MAFFAGFALNAAGVGCGVGETGPVGPAGPAGPGLDGWQGGGGGALITHEGDVEIEGQLVAMPAAGDPGLMSISPANDQPSSMALTTPAELDFVSVSSGHENDQRPFIGWGRGSFSFAMMDDLGGNGYELRARLPQAGGLQLAGTLTQPACTTEMRGTLWFTESDADGDAMQVCAKAGDGVFSWRALW